MGGPRSCTRIRAGLTHWERLRWTLKEVAAPWGPMAFSEWQVLVRIHTVNIQRTDRPEKRGWLCCEQSQPGRVWHPAPLQGMGLWEGHPSLWPLVKQDTRTGMSFHARQASSLSGRVHSKRAICPVLLLLSRTDDHSPGTEPIYHQGWKRPYAELSKICRKSGCGASWKLTVSPFSCLMIFFSEHTLRWKGTFWLRIDHFLK